MASIVPMPQFFALESSDFPGYKLTQRGTQLVLALSNRDNPFQLWFKDTSWQSIYGDANVYINHGSKLALKPARNDASSKATVGSYNPVVEDASFFWSESAAGCAGNIKLTSKAAPNDGTSWLLATTKTCTKASADGIPAIVASASRTSLSASWKVVPFDPKLFTIENYWVSQILTYKTPRTDVNFQVASPARNDEANVVGVHPNNKQDNALWYRVPAGGKEDTTFYSSFIVINKPTGLALKGSTKPGDKALLTEYDVLDMNFVWSENRVPASITTHVAINLSTAPELRWTLPTDETYQNTAWYHPLTLRTGTDNFLDRQAWNFKPVPTS